MSEYEKRIEVRRIVSRFPTGEIEKTESLGLEWVDMDEEPTEGFVYCPVSSHAPEALEMNIRKKKNS